MIDVHHEERVSPFSSDDKMWFRGQFHFVWVPFPTGIISLWFLGKKRGLDLQRQRRSPSQVVYWVSPEPVLLNCPVPLGGWAKHHTWCRSSLFPIRHGFWWLPNMHTLPLFQTGIVKKDFYLIQSGNMPMLLSVVQMETWYVGPSSCWWGLQCPLPFHFLWC